MAKPSLLKILDQAFSAPTFECFNYHVLHSLLRSMLGYLRMQDLPILEEGQDLALLLRGHLPTEEHPGEVEGQVGDLGTGHELLAPRKDQGMAGSSQITDVAADVAADVQQLKNKIEENESGVTQAMALSQDLLEEVGGIKAAQSQMAEEVRKIQEALGLGGLAPALEGPGRQPGSLGLQAGVQEASVAPEQQAGAASGWPGTSDADATSIEMQPRSPGVKTTTPESPSGTPCTQTSTLGMQPESPGIQTTSHGMQPAHPGTQKEGAVAQPGHCDAEPDLPPREEKVLAEATPGALAMQRDARSTQLTQAEQAAAGTLCVETEEGLPQIGQLGQLYAALKEQVSHLAATKLDRSELEKLHQPTPEKDLESITSILADLWGHMSSLSRDLQSEQEKIRQLEDVMAKLGSAGEDRCMDGHDQITGQLGSVLQEIKNELKELGEQHMKTEATLQRVVAKEAEQRQEQLRVIVKSAEQEPAEAQAACPICSKDIGVQVELLLQRYEKLQELVDYLMSRPTVGKAVRQLPERSQDRELLKSFQATVVQMQADYTKIRSVTDTLLGDLHQKKRDIEALFHSVETLQKEKADKEELLLKANRSALASKVSRAQFEAWMEQLNEMIQETMRRVTGLEQGSTQVQQQLSNWMDSKLDHVELEPFRQELEERWKRNLEQLQEKVLMTVGDAAGIKKQLLEHFHCVSCDRPVDMLVPGPKIASIPTMPALPPRFAGRPPTIIELRQTQQHGHREQVDQCRYPSMPPQCGGLRTVTQPLQRFQPAAPSTPRQRPPRTLLTIKAGIVENARELLAQNGHRDQAEEQPPVLISEDGFSRHQPNLSPRPLGPRDTSRLLLRPRSASSFCSQPGTDASS